MVPKFWQRNSFLEDVWIGRLLRTTVVILPLAAMKREAYTYLLNEIPKATYALQCDSVQIVKYNLSIMR